MMGGTGVRVRKGNHASANEDVCWRCQSPVDGVEAGAARTPPPMKALTWVLEVRRRLVGGYAGACIATRRRRMGVVRLSWARARRTRPLIPGLTSGYSHHFIFEMFISNIDFSTQ